jgi:hypothetical protein
MWAKFRSSSPTGKHPLDSWTRSLLGPIAAALGAAFVHPSDEPFQPFQRWAARADTVFNSPIGLLIHPTYGLWHAYRGAFVFDGEIAGIPEPDAEVVSPCLTCTDRPCLDSCPVDAFTSDGYDVNRCAGHLAGGDDPDCGSLGCHARTACPVGVAFTYAPDQMRFHMDAFSGTARGER